jgi:precorrin-6A synthase
MFMFASFREALPMRKVLVIGIGAGDPEQLTIQAIKALNRADVFFVLDKGPAKADLVRLRKAICERFVERQDYRVVEARDPVRDEGIASYSERVAAWHEERAQLYEQLLLGELGDDGHGAFLVWGDPSLYDSTLRILERVRARGAVSFDCEVIPGISAVQALAARHGIALHAVGAPVYVTTGRRLAERGALPEDGDVVVMLDGGCAWKTFDDPTLEIFWGAYLGTEHELLVSGRLHECSDEIERLKSAARAERGWIMDTYLIRRPR